MVSEAVVQILAIEADLLVVEVKRSRDDIDGEVQEIKTWWFPPPHHHQYGAVVVINEENRPFSDPKRGFPTMPFVDGKVSEPCVRNTADLPPMDHHKPNFVRAVGGGVPTRGLAVGQLLEFRKRNFHDASLRN